MTVDRTRFNINLGLAKYDETAIPVDSNVVTLEKVLHIDLDSVIVGCEAQIYFLKPTAKGFIYLSDIKEVADAYDAGELYHSSGNY
jgi:hypothetical protein